MIFNKLFTGIVFVICTFAYSQTYAQMTATIVWDEIKQIASENGFKISAVINQSAEGFNIEEFSLIKKASENKIEIPGAVMKSPFFPKGYFFI